jgi:hypothetical protein
LKCHYLGTLYEICRRCDNFFRFPPREPVWGWQPLAECEQLHPPSISAKDFLMVAGKG